MGTFHDDKGELHGITVVVETTGDAVYVGRCDTRTAKGIVLLDADEHREGDGGRSNHEYIERASQWGVFKKFDRIAIPEAEIASVRRLGEIAAR